MKIRTALLELGILLVFLAGSVYSYSKFKYDYASPPAEPNMPPVVYELSFRDIPPEVPRMPLSGRPDAPRLAAPGEGAFFYNGPGNPGICFYWEELPGASAYTLRISPREDLRDPLYKETVHSNYFILRGERAAILPETVFYWAVMQTDIEGETSAYSPPRMFKVGL